MYRYLQKCLYRGLCPKLSTNIRKWEKENQTLEYLGFRSLGKGL